MEQMQCACGCGQLRPKFDKRGRTRKFIPGHQNREKTREQIEAAKATLERVRPHTPWNKGLTYVHHSKKVYANKGSWNKALRRLYPDICMRCGWSDATCDTHHIISKKDGGVYSLDNGIILCPNCHRLANTGQLKIDELRSIKEKAKKI